MRVLAVGCHPDDLEINAFGTLARCVHRGDEVIVCGVANGSGGSMVLSPEESAALRIKEATAAARVIGAKDYINLNVNDLMIDSRDQALIDKMIDVVRMAKPDIIITHGGDEYQRDHNETAALIFNASFMSAIPNYKTQYPCHITVAPLFFIDGMHGAAFVPTDYVDISDTIETKMEALACHASQVEWLRSHAHRDVLATTRATALFRGRQCGVEYAEGFARCNMSQRMTPFRMLPEGR